MMRDGNFPFVCFPRIYITWVSRQYQNSCNKQHRGLSHQIVKGIKDKLTDRGQPAANLVPRVYSAFKMAAGRREDPGIHWRNSPWIVEYFVTWHTIETRFLYTWPTVLGSNIISSSFWFRPQLWLKESDTNLHPSQEDHTRLPLERDTTRISVHWVTSSVRHEELNAQRET